jgi:hypothetical protein
MEKEIVKKYNTGYTSHWRTQGGGLGGSNPRNSEGLKKLGQIPSSVEYTSVAT